MVARVGQCMRCTSYAGMTGRRQLIVPTVTKMVHEVLEVHEVHEIHEVHEGLDSP